jgi:hypothetical protein
MFDFDDIDPSEKIRLITVSNGVTYKSEQTDPFGFWHLTTDKGALPKELQGSFTTFEKAHLAVKNYLVQIKEKIVKVTNPSHEFAEGASEKDLYDPPTLQRKRPKINKVVDHISLG